MDSKSISKSQIRLRPGPKLRSSRARSSAYLSVNHESQTNARPYFVRLESLVYFAYFKQVQSYRRRPTSERVRPNSEVKAALGVRVGAARNAEPDVPKASSCTVYLSTSARWVRVHVLVQGSSLYASSYSHQFFGTKTVIQLAMRYAFPHFNSMGDTSQKEHSSQRIYFVQTQEHARQRVCKGRGKGNASATSPAARMDCSGRQTARRRRRTHVHLCRWFGGKEGLDAQGFRDARGWSAERSRTSRDSGADVVMAGAGVVDQGRSM
ncbi:hypothetical protein B0H13DRAFT_1877426 [Mycena leptocephala]|nr:hypothetical protein B0H13DRAFT_1877426 [Mycena leptocephala]